MIGRSILGDYKLGTEREFLLTNGLGSYSNGSINGNHARQYHGLFLTSNIPPLDRYMLVHKVEEELSGAHLGVYKKIKGNKVEVQEGYKYLVDFSKDPFAKWNYYHKGAFLEKEQFMVHGREILGLKYRLKSSAKEEKNLKLNFFMNYRDIHQMLKLEEHHTYSATFENGFVKINIEEINKTFYMLTNGNVSINEELNSKEYDFEGNLLKEYKRENLAYDIELGERGGESLDSSINLITIDKDLREKDELWVLIINEEIEDKIYNIDELYQMELNRVNQLKDKVSKDNKYLRDLTMAADDFIVKRDSTDEYTVLAGYPWFGDWGRDTMIALPGLTLVTGRYKEAESILKTFSKYESEGMLPNKFPDYDGEELMYNTIDASLWYFYAIEKYLEYTENYDFVKKELLSTMTNIIECHMKGTRYNIKVDKKDGFLYGGSKKTQLTWMDVKYNGWAVTPRYGKAVEINALWYNALKVYKKIMENLGNSFSTEYQEIIDKIKENFEAEFWNEKDSLLYDTINEEGKNSDNRCNQVFVYSLVPELISAEKAEKNMKKIRETLYTLKGLRSIDEEDNKYIGKYFGSLYNRDRCYHQGTVWGWPIGHYIEACYNIFGDKQNLSEELKGLKDHFYSEGCINQISEIFDGIEPNEPRGCYAQAWSVSEVLRVVKEIIEK